MNYIFHPDAKKELVHAISYYEDCQEGLGSEFLEEVYSTIQRIITFSLTFFVPVFISITVINFPLPPGFISLALMIVGILSLFYARIPLAL